MSVDVLLGLQWGDEGKGKIVDYLAPDYDIIARFQGGPNAGHTIYHKGKKIVLHHIPSGIFHDNLINLIGDGVVIDPVTITKEIQSVEALGHQIKERLLIAEKAHLILPTHRLLDGAYEQAKGTNKIGSTLRGIGPTYTDKIARRGLRIGDIFTPHFDEKYQTLKAYHLSILAHYDYEYDLAPQEAAFFEGIETLRAIAVVNSCYYINNALNNGKRVLAEGAQGSMLDINYGTYPYVTSSNTVSAGVCTGLGIAPDKIEAVIGISKAYCTRVGGGPFPTELTDEVGEAIRQAGGEFGATTGRPRRCGWIDLPALKYAIILSGVTELVITKVDILNHFDPILVCTAYEYDEITTDALPYDLERSDLKPIYKAFAGWGNDWELHTIPDNLQQFVDFLEQELDINISLLSVGPGRDELIEMSKELELD